MNHPIDQIAALLKQDTVDPTDLDDLGVALVAAHLTEAATALADNRRSACHALHSARRSIHRDALAEAPTPVIPRAVRDAIDAAPRGSYQRGLLAGDEAWSGSSLRGRARNYGARYRDSREGLIARLNATLPDLWIAESRIVDRRRVLVIHYLGDLAEGGAGSSVVWPSLERAA